MMRSALTQADLINTATVSLVQGQIIRLGERKIEAGEELGLGFGEQSGQDNSQGRLYASLKDNNSTTPVQLHGLVRFTVYSPQNHFIKMIGEYRTESLLSGETDVRQRLPFAFTGAMATEDRKIAMEFISDTNATLSKANSKVLVDTTLNLV